MRLETRPQSSLRASTAGKAKLEGSSRVAVESWLSTLTKRPATPSACFGGGKWNGTERQQSWMLHTGKIHAPKGFTRHIFAARGQCVDHSLKLERRRSAPSIGRRFRASLAALVCTHLLHRGETAFVRVHEFEENFLGLLLTSELPSMFMAAFFCNCLLRRLNASPQPLRDKYPSRLYLPSGYEHYETLQATLSSRRVRPCTPLAKRIRVGASP